jgi:hypothetical protein
MKPITAYHISSWTEPSRRDRQKIYNSARAQANPVLIRERRDGERVPSRRSGAPTRRRPSWRRLQGTEPDRIREPRTGGRTIDRGARKAYLPTSRSAAETRSRQRRSCGFAMDAAGVCSGEEDFGRTCEGLCVFIIEQQSAAVRWSWTHGSYLGWVSLSKPITSP